MARTIADLEGQVMENVLKTQGINYLGKMFRDGDRLIQLVKIDEIVPAEMENMLTVPV